MRRERGGVFGVARGRFCLAEGAACPAPTRPTLPPSSPSQLHQLRMAPPPPTFAPAHSGESVEVVGLQGRDGRTVSAAPRGLPSGARACPSVALLHRFTSSARCAELQAAADAARTDAADARAAAVKVEADLASLAAAYASLQAHASSLEGRVASLGAPAGPVGASGASKKWRREERAGVGPGPGWAGPTPLLPPSLQPTPPTSSAASRKPPPRRRPLLRTASTICWSAWAR